MTFLLPCLNTPLIIPVRYTAKSDYFLIPVYPNAKAVTSFVEATHPMHLDNYGNRAWCRLEVYVFSCLVEIQSRPISCFAFGLHTSVSSDDEIPESMMKTGMTSRSMFRCLGSVSKEKLVPLFGHASGAAFATTYLPSSGDLTVEDDRDVVRDIEKIIQTAYSTFAIKKETDRLLGKNNGSSLSTRDCVLNSKQIHDRDIVFCEGSKPSTWEATLSVAVGLCYSSSTSSRKVAARWTTWASHRRAWDRKEYWEWRSGWGGRRS